MKKLKVGILYGGRSPEHEVSIKSAKNVFAAMDKSKIIPTLLFIPKSGKFDLRKLRGFDVIFPLIHGINGEDGTLQGLLKFLDIPFVGPGVLASAICMNKFVTKKLLQQAKIPVAKFEIVDAGKKIDVKKIIKSLGLPVFVKPVNQGSSVGITKVKTAAALEKAVRYALEYDPQAIIEEAIVGREIECSVIGNAEVIASLAGEVIPQKEFYDYKAKYIAANDAILVVPAQLTLAQSSKVRKTAVQAYKVLGCVGMARVDFFLKKNGTLILNELNTIPGFTDISMYPKLWQVSGLSYPKLIDELLRLALKQHKKESSLKLGFK